MTGTPEAPTLNFDHLESLTDDIAVFEHADHATPRPEHGYCVDDAARALVVVCSEPDPGDNLTRMARTYLAFVLSAVAADGRCHNRMAVDGTWSDEPGLADCWGRALWGLGFAAVHAPSPGMRARALAGYRIAAQRRSCHSRAMAFATFGAAELFRARPGERAARSLLADAAAVIAPPGPRTGWAWPEPRLRYANGAVAEALLLIGTLLPDTRVLDRGIELLRFLSDIETGDGHLSVTPVAGRGPDDRLPAFDQQAIEVASLAAAYATAHRVLGAAEWRAGVGLAWRWFLGENDSATAMFDPATGGGYDGLERGGRNRNQGAESTIAMLATAQHARQAVGACWPRADATSETGRLR